MNEIIDSEAALESHLGRKSAAMDLKVIDHLDDGATRWVEASILAAMSFGAGASMAITLAGGRNFASCRGATRIEIETKAFDDPEAPRMGTGFGALFLVPGIGETLRLNGRVAAVDAGRVVLDVAECFMHCAKASIRSGLWQAGGRPDDADDIRGLIGAARLMFLGTASVTGIDVSPKGDPAGSLVHLDGEDIWFAERPGNRRADSLRNLLLDQSFAAILLAPGSNRIVVLSGEALITSRPDMRRILTVQGKTPALATRLSPRRMLVLASPSLERAQPWTAVPAASLDPATIMSGHVRLNRMGGIQAKIARSLASMPGLLRHGLASDYKRNLY